MGTTGGTRTSASAAPLPTPVVEQVAEVPQEVTTCVVSATKEGGAAVDSSSSSSSSSSCPESKEEFLLYRIGGDAALHAAVEEFYVRILQDERLTRFFEDVNMEALKSHQRQFLRLAFTEIPDGFDVGRYLLERHAYLFADGLNEHHFDMVAGHLVDTLKHLVVPSHLIDEAVSIVAPLRDVFVKGAAVAAKRGNAAGRRDGNLPVVMEGCGDRQERSELRCPVHGNGIKAESPTTN